MVVEMPRQVAVLPQPAGTRIYHIFAERTRAPYYLCGPPMDGHKVADRPTIEALGFRCCLRCASCWEDVRARAILHDRLTEIIKTGKFTPEARAHQIIEVLETQYRLVIQGSDEDPNGPY